MGEIMAYLHMSQHEKFSGCRASIDEKTGETAVWVQVGTLGGVAFKIGEVDAVVAALMAAHSEAFNLFTAWELSQQGVA